MQSIFRQALVVCNWSLLLTSSAFGQVLAEEFRLTDALVCKSVKGLRDYERLDPPELTTYDKLIVYTEPSGYATRMVDRQRKAAFIQNAVLRAKGLKKPIFERKELYRFEPEVKADGDLFYLSASIGFKNLPPGEYTLELETVDLASSPEQKVAQTIQFRIIPATNDQEHGAGKQALKRKK